MKRISLLVLLSALALLLAAASARGSGSGSLVVQAIIAAVVAVPFFFRSQVRRLWRRLHSEKPAIEPEGDAPVQ